MLQECAPMEFVDYTVKRLEKGVLLVSKQEGKNPNVMTISWGFVDFSGPNPCSSYRCGPNGLAIPSLKLREFVVSIQPPYGRGCPVLRHPVRSGYGQMGIAGSSRGVAGVQTPGIKQAALHMPVGWCTPPRQNQDLSHLFLR